MKKYIRKAHRALKIATLCDDPEEEDIFIFISAYFRHRALQNKPRRFIMLTDIPRFVLGDPAIDHRAKFRFEANHIAYLAEKMFPSEIIKTKTRLRSSNVEALCIVLLNAHHLIWMHTLLVFIENCIKT